MKFKKIHPNFALPLRGSDEAGGLDIYMPEAGNVTQEPKLFPLGFAAAVPKGHVALILPRSSVGAKQGLELNNTVGVIDSDYRGQWGAYLRTKPGHDDISFAEGHRLLQMVVVPVADIHPELVEDLDITERGEGGFGSTGVSVKSAIEAPYGSAYKATPQDFLSVPVASL